MRVKTVGTIFIIGSLILVLGLASCNNSELETSSTGDTWMEFGKAIVAAGKANDSDRLLHDFSVSDLDELSNWKKVL